MSNFQDSPDKFVANFGELLDTHFDELSAPSSQSTSQSNGFGRYLRAARTQRGLTPKALAHELNQNEAYVYALEHGMIPAEEIDEQLLARLATIFQEETAFLNLLLGRPIAHHRQNHLQKFSDTVTERLADVKSQLSAVNFGSYQFKPFHFAPSLVVTAIVYLLLISQDTFQQQMISIQLIATPTAMITYQPAHRYTRRPLTVSHSFCAVIQPDSPQGNTLPSLVCDPEQQSQPYRQEPEPRGGYSRGI